MKTTQVRLDKPTTATLREIALGFGFEITRGMGTGEGNIRSMLEELARQFERNKPGVYAALGQIFIDSHNDSHGAQEVPEGS